MSHRIIPDPVMKVIVNGLLDSSWGMFRRSTIVRLTVDGDQVKIGIGEGCIHGWEVDILRSNPLKSRWIEIDPPELKIVKGIKYIPERMVSGMPRGLLPIYDTYLYIFVSSSNRMIYPAYRCFDINLGERRVISIISPKTLIKDIVETIHPIFPKERYRRRVNNVEVSTESLKEFFEEGYGVGILKENPIKAKGKVNALTLLGSYDVRYIIENVKLRRLS
ncbi:MAG: hypothetical protein QW374_05060 [Candidatus Bathyarchaeia archaeon]